MLLAWFVWSLEEEAERLGGAGKDNGDTAVGNADDDPGDTFRDAVDKLARLESPDLHFAVCTG